jgi:hypothetical protein
MTTIHMIFQRLLLLVLVAAGSVGLSAGIDEAYLRYLRKVKAAEEEFPTTAVTNYAAELAEEDIGSLESGVILFVSWEAYVATF